MATSRADRNPRVLGEDADLVKRYRKLPPVLPRHRRQRRHPARHVAWSLKPLKFLERFLCLHWRRCLPGNSPILVSLASPPAASRACDWAAAHAPVPPVSTASTASIVHHRRDSRNTFTSRRPGSISIRPRPWSSFSAGEMDWPSDVVIEPEASEAQGWRCCRRRSPAQSPRIPGARSGAASDRPVNSPDLALPVPSLGANHIVGANITFVSSNGAPVPLCAPSRWPDGCVSQLATATMDQQKPAARPDHASSATPTTISVRKDAGRDRHFGGEGLRRTHSIRLGHSFQPSTNEGL